MKIYVTTVLGSPAAECAHFGICQVDSITPEQWEAFQSRHFRQARAILSRAGENGQLRFEFPFAGMRADTRKMFFSPAGFRVDSPGRLPDLLAAEIGTEAQLILPGVYPLVFSNDGVLLDVEIIKDAFVPATVCATYKQLQISA